jgi:hypothetical protein
MEFDRMVIKAKDGKAKLIVAQDNLARAAKPCLYFTDYEGFRQPKCNCQPCWDRWTTELIKNPLPKEQ